ncbi:hypothetical protein FRC08_009552 [Ceratobasidium sp. 394]|nr:hypothetical protein FRC08_009552 [Ceratobasidium sp. 394]KAG9081960.1 hypothetical protein FS749_007264 [Ceratobasidium sp. UAMH 11750]
MEDIFAESFGILGEQHINPDESGLIRYGRLKLLVAAKEGKATTLLADALFSPSLFLAEQIQLGEIEIAGKGVLELGSGVALPLLLASTLDPPPSIITLSDYPDESILGNLRKNVAANRILVHPGCQLNSVGYAWGSDVTPLLSLLPPASPGYDTLILSDLLHFDSSHSDILSTVTQTLSQSPDARVYVAAGLYTRENVRDSFLRAGEAVGLEWALMPNDGVWRGQQNVRSDGVVWSQDNLNARKANVIAWVGHWKPG